MADKWLSRSLNWASSNWRISSPRGIATRAATFLRMPRSWVSISPARRKLSKKRSRLTTRKSSTRIRAASSRLRGGRRMHASSQQPICSTMTPSRGSKNMHPAMGTLLPEEIPPELVLRAMRAVDFRAFIEFAFGVLRPGTPFRPNWHIDAMAHKLSQIASGEVKRLIITLPPRNLKSICASVALPAWFLGHHPSERVVAVSYSDALAKTHAHDFRKVVSDPIYQTTFPAMQVSRATDSEIHTTLRGRRYATSIEGTLTGRGRHLFILADPMTLNDALSESARARSIEWYRSTLVTRPDDKKAARIVVVMQRVHEEDLVGYLLEQGGFEILNLPAIAQSDATYELGEGQIYAGP